VLAAVILLWASMPSIVAYYRTLKIDPTTLKVSYSGAIWFGAVRDIPGDYYESMANNTGREHHRYVEHLMRRPGAPLIKFGSMWVRLNGMLEQRSRLQLLARFPEATIVAETSYRYAGGRAESPPEVLVSSREDLGWEEAREETALPRPAPPRITGAVLVRILTQPDGSVCVASANYRLDGSLHALATRHQRNGALDSTSSFKVNGQACGDEVNYVDEPSRRDAFGLPGQFIAADYLREPVLPPAARAMPAMLDLVVIEYNLNEWMRRDRFVSGTRVATQFLHFKDLPEDIALARLDKGFGSR
jgi:hypothetical protein